MCPMFFAYTVINAQNAIVCNVFVIIVAVIIIIIIIDKVLNVYILILFIKNEHDL